MQQELRLQMALDEALIATEGYAAPAVGNAFARALELCRQVGQTPAFVRHRWIAGVSHDRRGSTQGARVGRRILRLSQNSQQAFQPAHQMMGEVLCSLGELIQARTHLERAIILYHNPQRRLLSPVNDPGVASLSMAALTLWLLGYPDQASMRNLESLTLAHELGHPFSLSYAFHCAAVLHQCLREAPATQEQAEALIALFSQARVRAPGSGRCSIARLGTGEAGTGARRHCAHTQGLAAAEVTGARLFQPAFLGLLGEAYGAAGQPDEGLTAVAEAFDLVSRFGNAVSESGLYVLKGELLLMKDESSARRSRKLFSARNRGCK